MSESESWSLIAKIRVVVKDIYDDEEEAVILSKIEKFFEELKKEYEIEYFIRY